MGVATSRRHISAGDLEAFEAYGEIEEFPKWIYLHSRPYTKIDDVVYTIAVNETSADNHISYGIYKLVGHQFIHVLTETFDITGNQLDNLSKTWRMMKDILPSLIMESLL